jgi:hypothetical protein
LPSVTAFELFSRLDVQGFETIGELDESDWTHGKPHAHNIPAAQDQSFFGVLIMENLAV